MKNYKTPKTTSLKKGDMVRLKCFSFMGGAGDILIILKSRERVTDFFNMSRNFSDYSDGFLRIEKEFNIHAEKITSF